MTERSRLVERVWPPAAVAVVLLGWWTVAAASTPPILLPTPASVVGAVLAEPAAFARATAISVMTAAGGLGLGTAFGLALAFVAVGSAPGRTIVEPAVVGFRIAPLTAVAPLVLLWFGTGIPVRILLVSLMTTFPVTVASIDGLASPPASYLDLLATVDASSWQTFRAVRVPAALPSVFAGVKLGAALAVTGTVVAELLTLRGGLGAGVWAAGRFVRTAELFAYLLVIALFGVSFYGAAALLERGVTRRWGHG
ncbi:ABC transporter permease [Halolamina rubra]|uniref:ABC transporter permease n=1 Tax=Halolamina rubra TaxID=1380430 RepID=UPI0006795800|nr:ABC transporter permease subunit [Halolamina rubra]